MSKANRQPISFKQADYDYIRQRAIASGYNVGAGNGSELCKFVLDCVFAAPVRVPPETEGENHEHPTQ